jgi:hypothetical protein
MRPLLAAIAALLVIPAAARAGVDILIDKDAQQMSVSVDGEVRYRWPVSTGMPSRETPNGTFRAFRMEEDHYSREFDDAPMPHSIFFTRIGHAIHGTFSEKQLGMPASHGCVRLSRADAATLYDLVERRGVLDTTVTLTGSSRVALARGPAGNRRAVGRRTDPDAALAAADARVSGRGRYGRAEMDDYDDPPPRYVARRDLMPPVYAPQPYYGRGYFRDY